MTAISDAVVIGVVLGLIFAAVSYYLQSRISQQDRKISLMENILLDLKVTTEQTLLASTEPGEISTAAPTQSNETAQQSSSAAEQKPLDDTESSVGGSATESNIRELVVETTPRARPASPQVQVERVGSASVGPNQEAMTYRELIALARHNSVSGVRNLSKAQLIEVLRSHRGPLVPVPTSGEGSVDHQDLTAQTGAGNDQETKTLDAFLPMTEVHGDNTGLASIHDEPEVSLVQ